MTDDASSPDEERPASPSRPSSSRPTASRAASGGRGKATASTAKAAASRAKKPTPAQTAARKAAAAKGAATRAANAAAAKAAAAAAADVAAAEEKEREPVTTVEESARSEASVRSAEAVEESGRGSEPAAEVVSDAEPSQDASDEPRPEDEPRLEDGPRPDAEPVHGDELVQEAEPVREVEPEREPPADPDPVEEPEPVVEPEPVEASEPVVEPEPVEASEPVVIPEPVVVAEPELADESAAPVPALGVARLTKRFGRTLAVAGIDLEIPAGSLFGIVGPNGAGKTTLLSMATGLLRPDSGSVTVYGADVWSSAREAKRAMGVLPDRLRLFDRLTGAEMLHYAGALRGLDRDTIKRRSADLAAAFGLQPSLHRLVSDYSVGMTKKIAIAAAMIHSPRLLVLDEPFESVDPVSAATVIGILEKFVAVGGTVVMSSHSMDLIERVCDSVAIIVDGAVLASGRIEDVLGGESLEDRFVDLAGGTSAVEGMEWLQSYSD